jgi:uroporphyrinogen III methyltransferase/synthase
LNGQTQANRRGHVYLVGAGPGDPGLITVNGVRALQSADVVLYDHLANADLLGLAPKNAERIDVGKERGHPRLSQSDIEEILIDRASLGRSVVRLKGGDPFVFGRGGEEGAALEKAGIPYTVVPGVSSAIAVPAYAGIPVSHRSTNSRIVILTGHDDPDTMEGRTLDALALPDQTLVILMGVEYFRKLSAKLVRHGLPASTPCVMIRWGTTAGQDIREGTVGTMERILAENPIRPPATIVIGRVAGKEFRLNWLSVRPLNGRRILLTRELDKNENLSRMLMDLGAEVIQCPSIEIGPPDDWTGCDAALKALPGYSWILFLSPNGVRSFFGRLSEIGGDVRSLSGPRIFAMGPATVQALASRGIVPDAQPLESHGTAVLEFFRSQRISGQEILVVRGDRGENLIPGGLNAMGARATTVRCYTNALPTIPAYLKDRIGLHLNERTLDLLVFYSPSAYDNFVQIFAEQKDHIRDTPCLAIGPTTEHRLKTEGIRFVKVPKDPTDPSVAQAILEIDAWPAPAPPTHDEEHR